MKAKQGIAFSAIAGALGLGWSLWPKDDSSSPVAASGQTTANKTSTAAAPPETLKKTPAESGASPKRPDPGSARISAAAQCQAALALTNPLERRTAFEKLLGGLDTLEELQGVLDAFTTLGKSGRRFGDEWALFWETLGHRDPKLAVDLIQKSGSGQPWYTDAVNRVVEQWGALDPQAAVKWLHENEALSGGTLDAALASVLQGYANKDLKAATVYALSVVKPEEPLFRSIAGTLTRAAMQQGGTEGVIAWFNSLTTDAQRKNAFVSVSNRLGEADPAEQREWLRAHAGQAYHHDDAYRAYAQRLAEQNPQAAMDFVFSEAPQFNNGQYAGLGYASYEWLMRDAAGFAAYVQSLQNAGQKKAVIDALKMPLTDVNFPMPRRRAGEKFLSTYGSP